MIIGNRVSEVSPGKVGDGKISLNLMRRKDLIKNILKLPLFLSTLTDYEKGSSNPLYFADGRK